MGAEVLETESVEYKRVSEKKKQLQIMIHEMKADIRKKESLIIELEDDLRKMQDLPHEGKINIFMRDCCVVLGAIRDEGAFMTPKYATQSSQYYYKVEKSVFESYISRLSELTAAEFISYCRRLSILREENNKILFSSGKIRAYFIPKKIIDEMKTRKENDNLLS